MVDDPPRFDSNTHGIRSAVEADLDAIVAIYNAAIPGRMATADTELVSTKSRKTWLCDRDPTRPLWVLERGNRVLGWLSLGSFYHRAAYGITAEVGVYIEPRSQRSGVASALMAHALVRAPDLGIRNLLGFIFAHNQPSLALFAAFGFESWGSLPRVALLDGVERDLLILGRRTGA